MNKNNELPDSLPSTTHDFQVEVTGNVTKRRYVGEFVCKIPTIKDQADIAKFEAALNGPDAIFLNEGVLKVHKQIAYLKYTITDYPKFWRESNLGYELRDPNVISEVYEKVLAFEEEWIRKIWGSEVVDGSAEEEKEA